MKSYLLASRPKTLPAAIVPVWVGCALAYRLTGQWDGGLAFYTVMGAVWIQVATNFFNDAIDSQKGADTDARLGPLRATAAGHLSIKTVYTAAFLCLLLAAVFGFPLFMMRGWPMIAIAAPSFYLAYGYTGGPLPLAYKGLGELFVILFFGVVAVMGTVFVQTGAWYIEAFVAGLAIGCLSAVLISINNLRDIDEDRANTKNTLAVKWGRRAVLNLVWMMILVAYSCAVWLFGAGLDLLYFLPAFLLGLLIIRSIHGHLPGQIYNKFLAMAALQLILYAGAFMLNCNS
ncbi:MAG: 1,4-dihydroxy-2-naphthoate octaprenyltransferase [Akkermansiaceae bacterium]|nr:1,4-dihydroxy-2-naphthoate octaprenyltransferase [Akkermansiaceae bacterium]